jgi:RND superfamily putative drug exporter
LLVPALVSLFGRWNWWLPKGLARALRVQPSPVAAAGSEPGLVEAPVRPDPALAAAAP